MKKIHSIAGEPLSLLKLNALDEAFDSDLNLRHQVVYLGDIIHAEVVINLIGEFNSTPISHGISDYTHATETSESLLYFEKLFAKHSPRLVLIVDDSNISLAAALTAIKMNIPVFNLDAGIRLHDRRIPQEVNRRAMDSITELFFTSEDVGTKNLMKEGADNKSIFEVGSLLGEFVEKNQTSPLFPSSIKGNHILCDFRHPSNDLDPIFYDELFNILSDLSELRKVIIPLSETSRNLLEEKDILKSLPENINTIPIPQLQKQLELISHSDLVLTDHGSTQQITTFLDKQCITFGLSTDRPSTVEKGTNHLVGTHLHEMRNLSVAILEGYAKKSTFVFQKASTKIVDVISSVL